MKDKLYRFPSIEAFRHAIKEVEHRTWYTGNDEQGHPIYDKSIPLPKLNYKGSIKLHGTNAGIIFSWNPTAFDYEFHTQSKGNVITPTKDNMGFAAFAYTSPINDLLQQIMRSVTLDYTPEVIRVYGEWCGGNIQKSVGITGLDKMFVIFAVKLDNIWLDAETLSTIELPEDNIFNIFKFPTFDITIDFNNLDSTAVKLAELTNMIEDECPVAKSFGVDNGTGEGIVWRCVTEGWTESRFWFKHKGPKHSVTKSKNKNKVAIDVERVNSIKELVDKIVTEARLLQGIDYLKENNLELSRKSLGPYMKWLFNDVVKEELDTIVENGFEPKEISGAISNKGREWFFKYEHEF